MPRKLTTEEFIEKARQMHGDRYGYDLVEYAHSAMKVKIRCKDHGVFEQLSNSHLHGRGCAACAGKLRGETAAFVTKAREIHGDKYGYDLVEYVNARTKVKILCKSHGLVEQRPDHHLKGSGCPVCGMESRRSDAGEFVTKAREVHGDTYGYELVEYVNNRTKVKITCLKHGEFEQVPTNHTSGMGCPKCSASKVEKRINKILDSLSLTYTHNNTTPFSQRKRYDFTLEEPKVIIEFDGRHHFRPVSFGSKCPERTYQKFLKTQQNDRLKDRLAVENGYSMFRIPYWVTELERALQLILETPTPSPAVYRLNQDDEGNVFLETLHIEECDGALLLAA